MGQGGWTFNNLLLPRTGANPATKLLTDTKKSGVRTPSYDLHLPFGHMPFINQPEYWSCLRCAVIDESRAIHAPLCRGWRPISQTLLVQTFQKMSPRECFGFCRVRHAENTAFPVYWEMIPDGERALSGACQAPPLCASRTLQADRISHQNAWGFVRSRSIHWEQSSTHLSLEVSCTMNSLVGFSSYTSIRVES